MSSKLPFLEEIFNVKNSMYALKMHTIAQLTYSAFWDQTRLDMSKKHVPSQYNSRIEDKQVYRFELQHTPS